MKTLDENHMSRTYRKEKPAGYNFWDKRKGKVAKKITYNAERRVGNYKNQINKEDLEYSL